MKSYKRWINKSFSRRISAFFIPLILVLLLTVGGVSYYIYYSSIMEETRKNIIGIVDQRNYTVDLYVQDVKSTVATLQDNEDIVYMLKNYQEMSVVDRFYRQERIDELLMNTSLVRDHILDCIIVGENGYQTNIPNRYNLMHDVNILEEDWLQPYLDREPQKFYFTNSHENNYYFNRSGTAASAISVVFPMGSKEKRIGYIIVDMDFWKMNELISINSETDDLQFIVANENGNIIFSDTEDALNDTLPEAVREKLDVQKAFWFTYGGEEYFCVHDKSDSTGWELMGIVPKKLLVQPAQKLLKILCFPVFLCFVLLTIFLSSKISKKVKEPLEEIVEQTELLDINHPKPFRVTGGVAEIGYLADKITEMTERINQLVRLVYLEEMRRKDAQIEALISQINPHFLYNTLQLIKTEAAIGHPKEVSETVNYLSRFLRYTISSGELYVPLQEELSHVGYYIEIYKKRFPDKYELEIEAEDSAKKIRVPKLILQPLVENAVKHGLRQKEGKGVIRISAKAEESLLICVEDNGVGVEQKEADELLKSLSLSAGEGKEHVGLRNVNERIRLSIGDGCGIVRLESRENHYFRVYLKIQKGRENV